MSNAAYLGRLDRLPVDQKGNRVFRLGNAVVGFRRRDPSRGRRDNAGRVRLVLKHPCADIDVMRRQIVAGLTE